MIAITQVTERNMTALERLNVLAGQLPIWVQEDIRIRVGDWMTSGGGADDPYIYQQLGFAKNVIRSDENARNG